MKTGIIGDIHGNLSALEAVLEDAEAHGVKSYACLGDVVEYGPEPCQCLERLQDLEITGFVLGNFDHVSSESFELLGFSPGAAQTVEWTRQQLTEEHRSFLKRLSLIQTFDGITLVHASLDEPKRWEFILDESQAQKTFKHLTTQLCFYGHTHVPLTVIQTEETKTVRRKKIIIEILFQELMLQDGERYLINPGSVGQPRDGDPRASYIIFNEREKVVQFRRVEYDVRRTQAKMLRLGFHEHYARRLEKGA